MSSGSTTQARGRNSLPTQTEAAATTKMAGSVRPTGDDDDDNDDGDPGVQRIPVS